MQKFREVNFPPPPFLPNLVLAVVNFMFAILRIVAHIVCELFRVLLFRKHALNILVTVQNRDDDKYGVHGMPFWLLSLSLHIEYHRLVLFQVRIFDS